MILNSNTPNMIGLFTILLMIIISFIFDRSQSVKFNDNSFIFNRSQSVKFNYHGENQLAFTSIVYRHGEGNPDSFYPNDPYKNLSFWPDGLGALTVRGKLQQFKLGKWLRKRYYSLIVGGRYSHDLLYVQSTDVDRTIMSALANLAGMFYPTRREKWSNLDWQPIPVHTYPKHLDKELLIVLTKCPIIKDEEERIRNYPLVKEYYKEHEGFFDYLGKHAGEKIRDTFKAGLIYTNLYIESLTQDNFTIPDWAKRIYPERMSQVSAFSFKMLTMSKTLKRLRGGPLLKEIITHMKQKISGTLRQNLWMYSAHDVTLTCLLDTMGVFQPHIPPLAATVMVELRKDKNKDYFVSVHYKNSTAEPFLLTIPGCTPSCPLKKFESLLSDVIPGDWNTECRNNDPGDISFEDY